MLDFYRRVTLEEECKRNPDLKRSDIKLVKEWLGEQDGLPEITDLEIILFLHSNFYDVDATKLNIKTYFECRSDYSEFFKNFNLNNNALVQVSDAM